jgi:hypothetical protein
VCGARGPIGETATSDRRMFAFVRLMSVRDHKRITNFQKP